MDPFVICVSCLSLLYCLSVPCSLMITYWVRAWLLCMIFSCVFVTFPYGVPGGVAQSVTCLAADRCLTADPGVSSSISVQSHTFMETDHGIISIVILLPSADSRRVVVSYKRKYVHKVLVNGLVKFAQEKSVARKLTIPT